MGRNGAFFYFYTTTTKTFFSVSVTTVSTVKLVMSLKWIYSWVTYRIQYRPVCVLLQQICTCEAPGRTVKILKCYLITPTPCSSTSFVLISVTSTLPHPYHSRYNIEGVGSYMGPTNARWSSHIASSRWGCCSFPWRGLT